MARIGIIVEFRIKPGQHAAFDRIIREHARLTLQEEPGCERFDVLQPLTKEGARDETRIMLCEVYRDRAAFEEHGRNPRLARVREAYAPLIEARTLTLCEL
ncbi:putative quinol monooxygenase [Caldovatus aquaticus]|uniref:Antibiotic biosynthesis monooxygenase n=1 Tax=Caldovatus aquaticus TaxID=2865671 RepID=A0ABS7EYM4_9PROT|nr:putative quinol monooxygenase [Caldovatus aquaticus]MBW8268198.1 antibiotic biosynthesis monooxygenase [Caldovatus aquaticus]